MINPNWLDTEIDQKLAVASYKRIRDMFRTPAIRSILIGPEYFPGVEYQSEEEILEVIKNTLMTIYHASCTCKMGTRNDSMAVVDHRARVFGVSGLRVVDASAFPFLPPGHPQSVVCKYPPRGFCKREVLISSRYARRENCGRYHSVVRKLQATVPLHRKCKGLARYSVWKITHH